MRLKFDEIARLLNGKIDGNPTGFILELSTLSEAGPHSLSFLANPKYERSLYSTSAGAVLVGRDFKSKGTTPTLIRVDDPYAAFAIILEQFERTATVIRAGVEQPVFVHSSVKLPGNLYLGAFSYISEKVEIGEGARIFPQVYIGENVVIGRNCVIFPGAKIFPNTKIGDHCTLHAGAVIGSEGFGYADQGPDGLKRLPQIGNVVLGDHVSIGANTTIDRATVNSTRIASGVKLDNLVQIGHNVSLGKHTAIAAQAGIAGSTTIGEHCRFGGQVGIVGHIEIPDKTSIAPKGGVMSSIKGEGRTLLGAPAMDINRTRKVWVIWRKLPEMQKKLEWLEAAFRNRTK